MSQPGKNWPAMFSLILRATPESSSTLSDPNLARQNPADYLLGIEAVIKGAIQRRERSGSGVQSRAPSSALGSTQREAARCRSTNPGRRSAFRIDSRTILPQWYGSGKITRATRKRRKLRNWPSAIRPQYLVKNRRDLLVGMVVEQNPALQELSQRCF